MVTLNEYIQYAIRNGLFKESEFFNLVMTIPLHMENKYYKVEKKKYYVKMDGKLEELKDITTERPIFVIDDEITLFHADMSCIKDKVDTTCGEAMYNYIIIEYPCKGKIPYFNDENTTIKKIESVVKEYLKTDKITTQEFLEVVDSITFLKSFARLITVSTTHKSITPPEGIEKFKKELVVSYNKKYGSKWMEDELITVRYINELKEFDNSYMKDDPTDGILVSGKVKDNSRAKMFLTFGLESGFKCIGEEIDFVDESLTEGFPKDEKKLAAIFNSNRAGSFSRGAETVNGGVLAKIMTRATNNMTIIQDDCKSTKYKKIYVDKDVASVLENRYIKTTQGEILIEDPSKYIGKTIEIRSPMYCDYHGKSICSVCAGKQVGTFENAPLILAIGQAGTILNTSMKKMHDNQKKLHKIDINDILI